MTVNIYIFDYHFKMRFNGFFLDLNVNSAVKFCLLFSKLYSENTECQILNFEP